jgi:hypothetical protein
MTIALYSTGPMEAFTSGISLGFVDVVNLTTDSVDVRVRLFEVGGTRSLVTELNFSVGSFSSDFIGFTVAELPRYEVTVRLDTPANVDQVLISYWGKDSAFNIIPSQRLIHEEFHRLL